MNKKIWLSCMLILLLAVAAGCGQKPTGSSAEGENGNAGSVGAGQTIQEPPNNPAAHGAGDSNEGSSQEQVKKLVIQTYFTDDQLDALIAKEKEISYSIEEEKYANTLKALQHSEEPGLLPLWGKVEFKQPVMKDGQLTIDLSLPDEARLGSGGEALAVESLTKALFQFEKVKAIEILVDGQQVETLMGHVELEHPFQRK